MYRPKSEFGKVISLELAKSQVGRGWAGLVEECYNICVDNEVDIAQIKEKYGTLRFYVVSCSDEVFDKIESICDRSSKICECCGQDGYTRDVQGWYTTLCDNCLNRKLEKYNDRYK